MFSEGLPLPLKLVISVPALLYGALIFVSEGMPRSWLGILAVVLIGVLVVISYLDYPLRAVWPVFVGVFLLLMCVLVFVRGIPEGSPVPFTQSELEVGLCAVLACLYILWGLYTGRKASMDSCGGIATL